MTVREWFRQMRAHDWEWQRGEIHTALDTAHEIHRQHNPRIEVVEFIARTGEVIRFPVHVDDIYVLGILRSSGRTFTINWPGAQHVEAMDVARDIDWLDGKP